MQKYVDQLLADLAEAYPSTVVYDTLFFDDEDGEEWMEELEEIDLSPYKPLSEWTGIRQEQLPPARMMSDEQIHALLQELISLLRAFNIAVAFHAFVPERKQYHAIREHWRQEAPFLKRSMHHLKYCDHDFDRCPLGSEYCQCALLDDYLADSLDLEEETDDFDDDLPWKGDWPYRRGLGKDDLDF